MGMESIAPGARRTMILPSILRSVFSNSHTWMRVFCEDKERRAQGDQTCTLM